MTEFHTDCHYDRPSQFHVEVFKYMNMEKSRVIEKWLCSLLISTPMDSQFGSWCFCSVSIPTLRHEWHGMVKLPHHFQVNVSW